MLRCPLGTKPSSEPMLTYCQMCFWEQSSKMSQNIITFIQENGFENVCEISNVLCGLNALIMYYNIPNGLVEDCSISIANALEILQSCTKPSICGVCSMATHIRNIFGQLSNAHDDVIKWKKHFLRYWPFVRGIHRLPHKGHWRRALMFSLICVWINGWVNNREAGDLRRNYAHYDVTVMTQTISDRGVGCPLKAHSRRITQCGTATHICVSDLSHHYFG